MKPIDQMNLAELAEIMAPYSDLKQRIINRLRVIHEETRWIPVSERMPTKEDGDNWGRVRFMYLDGIIETVHYTNCTEYFSWQRITPPEDV